MRNSNKNEAPVPQLTVAAWKAMPIFAVFAGLVGGVQLVAGFVTGTEHMTLVLAVFYAVSILPWGIAGAVYARMANRSGKNMVEPQNRAVIGAKAGTLTSMVAWGVLLAVLTPWLVGTKAFTPINVVAMLAVFAAAGFVGAAQGAITGLLIGRLTLEPANTSTTVA